MVTKKDVFDLLTRFNIKSNDTVIVHSALRKVGKIEGGADGLIDAFMEYLNDGHLIIPTHTWAGIAERLYYDVNSTPTCLGALSKVAVERTDGVRSLHPTHSIKVFGKKAKKLVKGEENCATPTAKNCLLSRLCKKNAYVLLLGVNQTSNTFLHAVEERLSVPDRITLDGLEITIKDYEGNTFKSPKFNGFGCKNIPEDCSEFFENYNKPLVELGAVKIDKLGDAEVRLCNTKKTYKILKKLWKNAEYDLCTPNTEIPEKYYK
ncbi:MAG: AAC(3) family N-acetyltransferase [Clostridia bacterium]|nr:AAC(3) family N-acetyltransferase [Clostridia bacterium]